MARMPLVFWASTAFMVLSLAFFVWRVVTGRPSARRSLLGGLLVAAVFIPIGWHAVTWLQAGHPEASETRHAAVVVQAMCSFGIVLVTALSVWLTSRNTQMAMPSRMSR
jgi:heme A synthase